MARKHVKIPKTLLIKGKRWRVYTEPDLPKWAKRLGITLKKQKAWACTYPTLREIHLSGDLKKKPQTRDMAVIHEIMHAVMPTNDKERGAIMGPRKEEKVITYMAPILANVLRQLKWK